MLSLHYSLFGVCSFWNVMVLECVFLECVLFGMCPLWNVPYLTDLLKGISVVHHSERLYVHDKFYDSQQRGDSK